jgi:hypothetical protein
MKVKLLKDQLVDPRRAEQMIRDKAAERVGSVEDSEVFSPPDEASKRETTLRTGRPVRTGPPELTGEVNPVAPPPGGTAVKVGSTEKAEVKANPDGSLVQVSVEDAAVSEDPRPAESVRPSPPAAPKGQAAKNDPK